MSTSQFCINRIQILEGLANEEFVVFFQPKINLSTGAMRSVEALVRWQHPRHGLLAASKFIELIDELGLMAQLTQELLKQSLNCAEARKSYGWEIGMAINIPPAELEDTAVVSRILSHVGRRGLACEDLTVEVTEWSRSQNPMDMARSLGLLRRRGIEVSIDDFGCGYASLELLHQIPFSELKIDRSFISGTANDPKATAIVESIVELAEKLHMQTVAEGIENYDDLKHVSGLGCHFGQGYLLGEPMAAERLMHYLDRREAFAPSFLNA